MDLWTPLAEGRTAQRFAPGRLIYLQGTTADQFYYIVRGIVKCFITSESGDERILTQHRAGDLIGEAAFFDGQPRVSSAVAVTDCELVSVDRSQLGAVFARCPDLAVSMLEYLARTIRLLSAHVDGSFLQADQRVARHLLSRCGETEDLISCTHEEIGSSIGVSRVTVSRILSALAKRGVLETGYRSLKILDRAALLRMAEIGDEGW